MKMFVSSKMVCATILCFIMAITLCACTKSEPFSSDVSGTLQTTSSASSTDTQSENSSEDAVASTSSTDNKTESSSKSSESSSVSTNKTPTSSDSTTTTPTTPKTPAQIIVGKWRGSLDMAPLFSEQGYPMEGTQIVSCDIEFTSNGIVYEIIDRESAKTLYTNLFTQVVNDMLTENNLTKEQFEASAGKTYDDYLNELVQSAMELIPQTFISAYKFEGNDLYVREQNDADFVKREYSFNGENKLAIVESGVSITYTRIG